eukprot:9498639-Pyramimonas_sp.AAC.1
MGAHPAANVHLQVVQQRQLPQQRSVHQAIQSLEALQDEVWNVSIQHGDLTLWNAPPVPPDIRRWAKPDLAGLLDLMA